MSDDFNNSGFKPNKQSREKFPFSTPEELAALATKAGQTVPEFMTAYFENLNTASTNFWYTAKRFKAKIKQVTKKKLDSGLTAFDINYYHGTNFNQNSRVQIIGLLEDDNAHSTLDIGKKAKEWSQQFLKTSKEDTPEVFLIQAYSQERYQNIIDVQLVDNSSVEKQQEEEVEHDSV